MRNTYAPVIVFVYNRPEHTKTVLESLAQAYGAEKTELFIFSDGEKGKADHEQVVKTRRILAAFKNKQLFRSVTVIERETNRGLAASVISGVNEVIKITGRVIVLEDDMAAQKGLLNFLNDALDYYENNKRIWSVSGYTIKMDIPSSYKKDVYFGYRGASCTWATWLDRWELCDWSVKSYSRFKYNPVSRHKLNRGGEDMAMMLDEQMHGLISSWAIRWTFCQYENNMLTVFPVKTLAVNNGYDGSGTNCFSIEEGIQQKTWDKTSGFQFCDVELRKDIVEMFHANFSGSFISTVKLKIRSLLLRAFHLVLRNDGNGLKITTLKKARKYNTQIAEARYLKNDN